MPRGVIRSGRSSCTAPITNVARRVVPARTGLVSWMSAPCARRSSPSSGEHLQRQRARLGHPEATGPSDETRSAVDP
jgi:hypothetical protein